MGDANAVLSSLSGHGVGALAVEEPDCAGACMACVLQKFGLVAVNTFPSAAYPDVIFPTWKDKCIDYICVPAAWARCTTQEACCLDLGNVHEDHHAIEALLCLHPPPTRARRGKGGGGRAHVSRAAPSPVWTVDVHSHAEKIFAWAKGQQSPATRTPCKPYLSEQSLALLDAKRACRRALRVDGLSSSVSADLVLKLQQTAKQLRRSLVQDKKSYLESLAISIRDGLDTHEGRATWQALRFFRPGGSRVKKPFRSLPILHDEQDQPARSFEEQQLIKARYFGGMEAATCTLPSSRTALPPAFDLSQVPTLCDVESCIARLPLGKAPGPSGVRNEFWKLDGVAAARLWLPLVVKMHRRGTEPFRLSSGTLHTLFKMKGPMTSVDTYRSIFLLEGIGKAFRKLMRPALLGCLQPHSLDLFYGASPGSQTTFLTHYLSAFRNVATAHGKSSMVLFVDAKSAYYRVVRQRLTGEGWTDQSLCELLHLMKVPPEALTAVLRWAEGPVLTSQLSEHQRRILEALFRSPCFVLRGLDAPFFSQCGTRPGDSIADVLFAIVLAECLVSLRERLHCEGLDFCPGGGRLAQPTCADDLAVPACCEASQVEAYAAALCGAVHEELGTRALELNYGPGKTELLISWSGSSSRAGKARVVGADGVLRFHAFGVQREVRLALSYDHLGTRLCDSGACGHDLKRKAARAVANSRPVAKSVLRWPAIALCHRRRILESLTFSVLCYNVAVWHKFTLAALRSWCQAVDSLAGCCCLRTVGLTPLCILRSMRCAALLVYLNPSRFSHSVVCFMLSASPRLIVMCCGICWWQRRQLVIQPGCILSVPTLPGLPLGFPMQ